MHLSLPGLDMSLVKKIGWKELFARGGLEDTDVAQNRLNRDAIVLGSGSNQNTFLVSDAQPCP